jgi:DNA replication and repair protein RecF
MNIFIGDNAQGKTNIIESIIYLAITKSYRVINENDLIKFDRSKAIIKGKIIDNDIIKKLEVNLEKNNKVLSINDTVIKRNSDYISNLIVISFTPNDLEIIKNSPSIRRNLLNIQISQLSNLYLNTLNEYNKILKTRNEYLKILLTNSLADKKYFDIITDKLIEKAIIIYKMRKEYIDLVNKNISKIYDNIYLNDSELYVSYEPNIEFDHFDDQYIRDKMTNIFKNNYKKELNNGMTLFGPHRDDFSFILDNNNLKFYGSQGQQKVSILSFKLAEISIFEEKLNKKPVLLFDDIFSELDIKKRNRLLKYVQKDIQTIITTTDIKNINKKSLENAYIFEVNNGKIERK